MLARRDERAVVVRKPFHVEQANDGDQQKHDPAEGDGNGPLCSLRRALLLWLVPLFLAVGCASAAFAYWSNARMVNAFMDDQMQQLAAAMAANQGVHPAAQSAERVHNWGAYVVQVYGADGRLRATSFAQLALGMSQAAGLPRRRRGRHRWRVYTVPGGQPSGERVQVAAKRELPRPPGRRARGRRGRARAAAAALVAVHPVGLARAMSLALQDIARQAAQQDEHNIAELPLRARAAGDRAAGAVLQQPAAAAARSLRDAAALRAGRRARTAHADRGHRPAAGEHAAATCRARRAAGRYGQLHAGVRRAQRLVDQLLRLSRQEAAGADGPRIVDLQAQLRESMNTLIGAGRPAQHRPRLRRRRSRRRGRSRCAASPGDLRSVLDNLIENALRYTPEGGVVDVRLLQEQGRMALEVVDTGPGIPQDLLPRVFDRFFRVPGTSADGSGLGLAIAQRGGAALRAGAHAAQPRRPQRPDRARRGAGMGLSQALIPG